MASQSQHQAAVNGKTKLRYACRPCRSRKIKCNGTQPVCSTCLAHERPCEYDKDGPRRRCRVPGSRRAERERRRTLDTTPRPSVRNAEASPQEQPQQHHQQQSSPHELSYPPQQSPAKSSSHHTIPLDFYAALPSPSGDANQDDQTEPQDQVDAHEHLAVGPGGNVEARGPTNTLYESLDRHEAKQSGIPEHYATAILTANTALEQQKEAGYKQALLERGDIEGVPAELALHLLDIHFSRHHFFLITYRTAFYRDMMTGGPYYSPLLLFAILAVSSRYSERPEVGGGDHSAHSGKDFYEKARQHLAEDMEKSTIPTATALLLMGNALVSSGKVDKGWLYTGMGIRMIMNLGLHLDAVSNTTSGGKRNTPEEIEIRRRLFWGAFVSEKLQSLYLGRPFIIHESDTHVPKKFLDVYEEGKIWKPFPDHQGSRPLSIMTTNSISSFTNMCVLAEICGDIMTSFYAVQAKREPRNALHSSRTKIRSRLAEWERHLPQAIKFAPWEIEGKERTVPIHVLVLQTLYLSLLILLERPFIANGHLSSPEENIGSWGECTIAAEKIAHLLYAYRRSYSFRRIPYQLCYTTYVASTILVRNVNNDSGGSPSIKHLAVCLKAFEEMKLAHPGSARMLNIIRSLMARLGVNVDDQFLESISTSPQCSEVLPNADFEASNSAAIHNRHINIDTIRQSFAQSPALNSQPMADNHIDQHQGWDIGNSAPVFGLEPDFNYETMQLPQQDPSDNSWDFSLASLDDDLLFGVLGSNWA